MCQKISAEEFCGHSTNEYYQKKSCHHTDVSLCGATNVVIMARIYTAGFTPATDSSKYDIHSAWFKDLARDCHLSGFGSRKFESFFFPLLFDRVSYYISQAQRCGCLEVKRTLSTESLSTRADSRMVWKKMSGWPGPSSVALIMHDHQILHDERLKGLGFTYVELCDREDDAQSYPRELMTILEKDLSGLPQEDLQLLLKDASREFRKSALEGEKLQQRLGNVREASMSAQKTTSRDPAMGSLAGDIDAMLTIDVSSLSPNDLEQLHHNISHAFQKAAGRAGKLKERCDEIYAHLWKAGILDAPHLLENGIFAGVVWPKVQRALEYKLKKLREVGAIYDGDLGEEQYAAWADACLDDGWDGDLNSLARDRDAYDDELDDQSIGDSEVHSNPDSTLYEQYASESGWRTQKGDLPVYVLFPADTDPVRPERPERISRQRFSRRVPSAATSDSGFRSSRGSHQDTRGSVRGMATGSATTAPTSAPSSAPTTHRSQRARGLAASRHNLDESSQDGANTGYRSASELFEVATVAAAKRHLAGQGHRRAPSATGHQDLQVARGPASSHARPVRAQADQYGYARDGGAARNDPPPQARARRRGSAALHEQRNSVHQQAEPSHGLERLLEWRVEVPPGNRAPDAYLDAPVHTVTSNPPNRRHGFQ
ncbi:hypothetical protein DL770_003533 [Monosporascus sp. CRB-9-2]|nr:hypothetical protein DL770_003533 [Monosporascus sp. CRB-9-2]